MTQDSLKSDLRAAIQNVSLKPVIMGLVKKIHDLSDVNLFGTPISIPIVTHYDAEVLQLCVKKKLDIKSSNRLGLTPLIWAAIGVDWEKVEILLDNGLEARDLDVSDIVGDTVLHVAGEFAEEHIIGKLINSGASLGLRNNEGRTAFDVISERTDLSDDFLSYIANLFCSPTNEAIVPVSECIAGGDVGTEIASIEEGGFSLVPDFSLDDPEAFAAAALVQLAGGNPMMPGGGDHEVPSL